MSGFFHLSTLLGFLLMVARVVSLRLDGWTTVYPFTE